MTLDDVNRLLTHWGKYPPLRDLVAAFIGFEIPKEQSEESPNYMTADDFRRLIGMTGGRIPGMG